jgi:hypothetical protein
MTAADYPRVLALWQQSDGVGFGESDSVEAVAAFLARNPGLSAAPSPRGLDRRRRSLRPRRPARLSASSRRLGAASPAGHRSTARPILLRRSRPRKNPECNIFVFREKPESIAFWTYNGWIAPAWQLMQKRVGA